MATQRRGGALNGGEELAIVQIGFVISDSGPKGFSAAR
jgi:hypothetical protein